ncbi:MAG TPA: SDR family oxidoreductase [bacterium]|nr:SDR family oxidoreductase [bacterium]
MVEVERKVALVIGGGGGIGRTLSQGLAQRGIAVAAADLSVESAEETAAGIVRQGGEAFGLGVNIAKKSEVQKVVEDVLSRWGRIDILINAAGILSRGSVADLPESEWDRVLSVNLKGVFLCTQAAARHMVGRRQGCILTLTSGRGEAGFPNGSHYSASKAGVSALTRTLAVELAPYNIRINAIGPGATDTAMYRGNSPAEVVEARLRRHPLEGGAGKPQDIVGTALFFVTEASSYVTGQIFYMKDPHAS